MFYLFFFVVYLSTQYSCIIFMFCMLCMRLSLTLPAYSLRCIVINNTVLKIESNHTNILV